MSERPAELEGTRQTLRLKVVEGNAAGTVIEVEEQLVIGREAEGDGFLASDVESSRRPARVSAENAGTLGNDVEISRRHARITCESDGRYVIEDLGSTNGTHVNGRRIEGPVALEAGDRIEVGASALIVQVGALPPTPRSTPVSTVSGPNETDSETAQSPPARPANFTLRIEVDVQAGEATVTLDEGPAAVRLVHENGRWRLV